MKRSPGYLVFSTYIPSVLIVVMSWISFWIPPESTPARVTLGVTSLLTLATLNTQTQQSLPPVSYTKVELELALVSFYSCLLNYTNLSTEKVHITVSPIPHPAIRVYFIHT